jgi:ATP-dependent protease ClpP protease subunit
MPGWSEIMDTVQQQKQEMVPAFLLNECKRYLSLIANITGRNIIVYYSGWLKSNVFETSINENDKNAFMNAVYGMDKTKGVDLILHTPGGDIAATESIVNYLKSLFGNNVRAIVPQISMSAGTMIAMSCKEIIMGRQSSLGPIDPQMNGVACQMVVDEFKRAVDEVRSNPASLGLWQTIIGKYSPTFLTACSDAIKWSEELAERWLTEVNPQINMNKVKNVFINHNHSYSHSRHISKEDCRAAGLPITDLEADQDLQDAVLSLHHCYMILIDAISVVKIVMNQDGRAYLQNKK